MPLSVLVGCLALFGAPARGAQTVGLGESLAAGKVVSGATGHRLIHFTFDDGPDPRTTGPLLDLLDRLGIKATFFFSASRFRGGKRNAEAPALAREALRRGHSIGSHSVDHVRMRKLSPPELRAQLDENEHLFERVFGARTFLFRPPFGSTNRALDRMLVERRYTNVMWNIGLADWVERPPEALLRTFVKVLERNQQAGQLGGVVLMHDTHAWTVEALGLIVAHLRERNCALLAEEGSELFDLVDDLRFFHAPADPLQPAAEAPPAAPDSAVLNHRQQRLRTETRARCPGR